VSSLESAKVRGAELSLDSFRLEEFLAVEQHVACRCATHTLGSSSAASSKDGLYLKFDVGPMLQKVVREDRMVYKSIESMDYICY
jgi:hypothetical protein